MKRTINPENWVDDSITYSFNKSKMTVTVGNVTWTLEKIVRDDFSYYKTDDCENFKYYPEFNEASIGYLDGMEVITEISRCGDVWDATAKVMAAIC